MTHLETYISVKTAIRGATEGILGIYGLNFKKLDALEAEVLKDIPPEGIKVNGLHFLIEERHAFLSKPGENAFDTIKRITIHSIK